MREAPNYIRSMRVIGDHLMMVGAHPQAAMAYHRAITRVEDSRSTEDRLRAAHLLARMASALLSEDLFLEAPAYVDEAMALNDGDAYVRYVHAFMLHAEGSDGEALDTLDDLVLEGHLQPWVTVARAEFDPASVDAAALNETLAEAVSKTPTNGALRARFSVACEGIGNYLEAVEQARLAAWLQPSLLRRWRRYGHVAMLANAYSDAADAFESAREISSFDPRIDALIARAHMVGGDVDASAAAVLRGLRKNSAHRDCLTILEALQRPNPSTMASALLLLESDSDVNDNTEAFIFVPPWPE